MANGIKSRIVLEGATEYNRSIREIDSNLKELRSEMKLNSEQFKESQNSAEALNKKSEILAKQYEEAGKKVELYASRLDLLRAKREEEIAKVEENNQKYQDAQGKLSELEITMGKTSAAYIAQVQVVEELKEKLQTSQQALEYFDQQETKLETSLNNATTEQLKYEQELNATNSYLKEAEGSTNKLATSIDEYGQKIDKAGQNTEKLDDQLKAIVANEALKKLGDDAEKVLHIFLECAEVAEQFEYSIAKVQSIARVSDDTLKAMSEEIRRVGSEMGYSSSEISEAVYQAISASVDASEAIGFVEDATKLARAGFTEVTTAVDVMTTALNAYGLEASETAHIADDLITTQNLGKTTVDELAQSIGTIIPTAAAYNVSLDQLSAAYSLLTKNGVNTAYATTYLRGMLNELADSGSDVAEVLYNETGHTFGELMEQGYSLGDVIKILGDTVDGNSESFANMFSNIRAGQGALNIFNAGAEEFNRVLGVMETNTGAVNEAFETMADTAVMTNARFDASVENLKIAIGESLSPAIEEMKEAGIAMLDPLAEFIERNPALVTAITVTVTAAAGLTAGMTALATATALAKAVFGDFSGVAVLLAAGVSVGIGALAGLAVASKDAAGETQALAKSITEEHEAVQKTYQDLKELQQSNENTAKSVKELRDRFEDLTKGDIENAETKKELVSVIAQLNELVPGLNISYENLTTGVDGNTEAILENIDALTQQGELQQKREEMAELEKYITETTQELAQAEENLAEITRQKNEATEQQNEYLSTYGDLNYKLAGDIEIATDAEKEAIQVRDECSQHLEEAQTRYEELSASVTDLSEKEEEAAESARAQAEAQKAVEDAIKEATSAIESQFGILDEWSGEADKTFSQMKEIWEGQNEGLDQYKEDLTRAKEIISGDFDPAIKDLTSSMVELDDAATLHEFIQGLDEAIESGQGLEELTQLWSDHLEKLAEAENLYAELTLAQQGYTEEATALEEEFIASKNSRQEEQNALEIENANTHKDQLIQITTDTVTGMSLAITTTTETALLPAVKTMGEQIVTTTNTALEINGEGRSEKFIKIGRDGICGGLAEGIRQGTSAVCEAIQAMCEEAVASVDISGIVSRIDAALGESLGG